MQLPLLGQNCRKACYPKFDVYALLTKVQTFADNAFNVFLSHESFIMANNRCPFSGCQLDNRGKKKLYSRLLRCSIFL